MTHGVADKQDMASVDGLLVAGFKLLENSGHLLILSFIYICLLGYLINRLIDKKNKLFINWLCFTFTKHITN
jgi:hypothetical protein